MCPSPIQNQGPNGAQWGQAPAGPMGTGTGRPCRLTCSAPAAERRSYSVVETSRPAVPAADGGFADRQPQRRGTPNGDRHQTRRHQTRCGQAPGTKPQWIEDDIVAYSALLPVPIRRPLRKTGDGYWSREVPVPTTLPTMTLRPQRKLRAKVTCLSPLAVPTSPSHGDRHLRALARAAPMGTGIWQPCRLTCSAPAAERRSHSVVETSRPAVHASDGGFADRQPQRRGTKSRIICGVGVQFFQPNTIFGALGALKRNLRTRAASCSLHHAQNRCGAHRVTNRVAMSKEQLRALLALGVGGPNDVDKAAEIHVRQ